MSYLIHTPRLRLREMAETDAPVLLELNSYPEVVRYTGDGPLLTVEKALEVVQSVQAQYAAHGMGRLMVERTDSGEILGWCGLKKFADRGEVDLGYRFFPRYWGAGYATESGAACLAYGFETLGLARILARAMPGNAGSLHVLEKLGFARCDEEMENGDLLWVFERWRT